MKSWYLNTTTLKVFQMTEDEYEEYMHYYGGTLVKYGSEPTKSERNEEVYNVYSPQTYMEKVGELESWFRETYTKPLFV